MSIISTGNNVAVYHTKKFKYNMPVALVGSTGESHPYPIPVGIRCREYHYQQTGCHRFRPYQGSVSSIRHLLFMCYESSHLLFKTKPAAS